MRLVCSRAVASCVHRSRLLKEAVAAMLVTTTMRGVNATNDRGDGRGNGGRGGGAGHGGRVCACAVGFVCVGRPQSQCHAAAQARLQRIFWIKFRAKFR
eukprot:4672420-Pleurochrysis_carterae.AAC.1